MIVTLCGSARFEPWFHAWNEALGLAGHASFGLCAWPSRKGGWKDWYTAEQKETLDRVHRDKIDASDAILVLNVFGYLGESTLREVAYAEEVQNIPAYFLESWGKGCGIGPSHEESYRRAAAGYGVPERFGSPIAACDRPDAWRASLLGPAGSRRTAIVRFLEEEERRVWAAVGVARVGR